MTRNLLWSPAPAGHIRLRPPSLYRQPERSTKLSYGYDLFLPRDTCVTIGDATEVSLNLLCAMPPDEGALLKPRSSHAKKYRMQVLGGVMDADYAEEWVLLLLVPKNKSLKSDNRYHHDLCCDSDKPSLSFKAGEKIAQVVFSIVPVHESESTGTPDEVAAAINSMKSNRTGGFGSTGI